MEFLFLCSICSIVTIYRGNIGFNWDVPSSIWFVRMLGEEAYLEQLRGFSNIASQQLLHWFTSVLKDTGILRFRDRCGHLVHLNIWSEEEQVPDPQPRSLCILEGQKNRRVSWEPRAVTRPAPHFMSGVRYRQLVRGKVNSCHFVPVKLYKSIRKDRC